MKFRLILLAAALALSARAEISLPSVIGDDMVLQRGQRVPVWGWAAPGEMVTVEFAGQKKSAKADASGAWLVKLGALKTSAAPPQVVALPATTNENNKDWQENVLRNAALAASIHAVARPGRHTLKLWIVDPGVVVDTIFAGNCVAPVAGYVGGAETLNQSR